MEIYCRITVLFVDRFDAGRKLAEKLGWLKVQDVIVLALPRGGVPVGYEIAKRLGAPLDVLVVRKLGAPKNSEFGIGAIAPENVRVLDETAIKALGVSAKEIEKVESAERNELGRRLRLYRGKASSPDLSVKTVILVDDGLATGVTAEAAIKYVLKYNPEKLVIAIPVCALDSVHRIQDMLRAKDETVCLSTPHDFGAVGLWYRDFGQVTDEEVVSLLQENKSRLAEKRKDIDIELLDLEKINLP